MAVKDTEPYLPQCLDSIVNQTYKNWELIAVNDHSSDNSPTILKEYSLKDNRIKVFDSDRPRLIPTLQVGYSKASGMLINRMDSDDKMPGYKLEVLVNEWSKYGTGHIVAGGTQHFVDRGEVGGGFLRYEQWLNKVARTNTHYQNIYKECVVPSHSWIIHTEDFQSVDAFNPIVYPEDYDLCFRFYRQDLKIIGIDKVLHFWRDRSDRISRTWDEYKDNRYFDLKLKYFYELDRDSSRPLVIWGAGKHGKDLVKKVLTYESNFLWVCNNPRKIGKEIYGTVLKHFEVIGSLKSPQIIVVVASPHEQNVIHQNLINFRKKVVEDFWYFL